MGSQADRIRHDRGVGDVKASHSFGFFRADPYGRGGSGWRPSPGKGGERVWRVVALSSERLLNILGGREASEPYIFRAARAGGALFFVKVIEPEMLAPHLDQRLHKLGLGIVGQLGGLLDQRLDFLLGCHTEAL